MSRHNAGFRLRCPQSGALPRQPCLFPSRANRSRRGCEACRVRGPSAIRGRDCPGDEREFVFGGHLFGLVLATPIQLSCQRFDNAKVSDRKQIAKLSLHSRPERKIGRTKNRPLLVIRLFRSEERVYQSSQRRSKLEDLFFLLNSADGTRPTVGIRGHGRR